MYIKQMPAISETVVKIGKMYFVIQVHYRQVTNACLRKALLRILGAIATFLPHQEGAAESHMPTASLELPGTHSHFSLSAPGMAAFLTTIGLSLGLESTT